MTDKVGNLTHRVERILERVDYQGRSGGFISQRKGPAVLIQFRGEVRCIKSGNVEWQGGRKFYISPWMTDDEIIRTAFVAVKMFEEHEINETFMVDGQRFKNPHPEGGRAEWWAKYRE